MELTLFQPGGFIALMQVLMIDVVLAGDNAVVIGMAAARVPPQLRKKVIFWGLIAAVGLRIVMAAIAVKLLAVIGLTLAGGILLLWVCWRMCRDIAGSKCHAAPEIEGRCHRPGAPSSRSCWPMSPCRWTMCWRWPARPGTIWTCW